MRRLLFSGSLILIGMGLQFGGRSRPLVLGQTIFQFSPKEIKLKKAVLDLENGLVLSHPEKVYQLLGSDLISVFGFEEFKKGWLPADRAKMIRTPVVVNEWAEGMIELNSENDQHRYLVIFHWENSAWKIFATERLK